MDVKDLRTETALSERNNDGSKYTQGGVALQCNRNKSYQDIGSNPLAKTESTPVRPCAVIGPDRVVPPPAHSDVFLKKAPGEPWPGPENVYRRPPEYPHKISNNQNPSRNISPRQTFQENMQRIMVPPTYNALRHSDDLNFNHVQDRNIAISKNIKPNMASEAKYCDVPYTVNTLTNEPKNSRDAEIFVPSANPSLTRTGTAPHAWPPGSVNVHGPRTYGAHELYQYPQYSSCASQRPTVIPMTRPHRTIQEDPAYLYPDRYYQDSNARFKPYPPVNERYPQPRYEYIGNYPSQFHPPPPQPHKYDIPKSVQPHPYSVYSHLKYVDNRVPDHTMEGYPRPTNQQPHYNLQFRNQVIQPTYAPVPGISSQNKVHPYPSDGSVKSAASNKLHYDNSKIYFDYENARTKTYPMPESYFVNEMGRIHPKHQIAMPNYPTLGMHSNPSQQYIRKDNSQMKPFEYMPHIRNFEPMNSNPMMRHAPLFSPNMLAISPTDSITSNDTSQTHGTSQEDCGYVSQSSTASVRSIDSGIYRLPHEYYKRYDFRYGPMVGSSHGLTKSDLNSNNANTKDNKQKIDVRQFLQMWNEGEEENCENSSKEIVIQTGSSDMSCFPKQQHNGNQDQLYVLGLVNVPCEELGKYEHIQKISKLPENIKGYNSLELLSQFEEAIESSNTTGFKSIPKEYHMPSKDNSPKQVTEVLHRPVSPLDVEAKISQSVIHKEVGCNFEIRPCSPKMLNVEVAATAQNVLGERIIEKVTNPLSKIEKSPKAIKPDENSNFHTIKRQENTFAINDNPSCKMVKSPYSVNSMDSVKTNYSLQDLEINSGVCFVSLPRLDNEIELNFTEVNQQFINANKRDGNSITNNYLQTKLVDESGVSGNKLAKNDVEKGETALIIEESEKTFTKLSKYRKLKTNSSELFEKNQCPKALRTDSVIIKNPENIKNIEDKLLENSLNVPINLSSQSSICHTSPEKLSEIKENDVDIALDFSLNKSGNDLPIIDIDKDEFPKSLTPHLPHIPYENALLTDPIESYSENLNSNETIASNSNDTKGIKTDHTKNTCIENYKNGKQDAEDNFDGDVNKSKIVTNVPVIDNVCSNSVAENTSLENKCLNVSNYTDHANTKEMSENLQTCKNGEFDSSNHQTWDKKHNTQQDGITNDNFCDEENLKENFANGCGSSILSDTEIVSKNDETEVMMRLLSPENEDTNLINVSEVNKSEHDISFQNKIDFENAEISASLEKLFQENNEDTVLSSSDNASLNIPFSMPVIKLSRHQSKELYSPWIQKLLTHSEGLCSNNSNECAQIKAVSSISKADEYINKMDKMNTVTFNENTLNEVKSHNMDSDQNNEKTADFFSSDAKYENGPESYTTNHQLGTVTDTDKRTDVFLSTIANKTHDIVEQLPEDCDVSNLNKSCLKKNSSELNADEICKINLELGVTKKETDINKYELNKLQDSKFVKQLLNCDSAIVSSVQNVENKPYKTDKSSELFDSRESVTEPNSITSEKLCSLYFENMSNVFTNNCTGYHNEENLNGESLLENVPISEKKNCCNIVSNSGTGQQTKTNQREENFIKNDKNNDGSIGKTSETSHSTHILGKSDNIVTENNKHLNLSLSLSSGPSGNDTRDQTDEKQRRLSFIENVIKNCDSDTEETSETLCNSNIICKFNNIVKKDQNIHNLESLTNDISENCTRHGTEEKINRDFNIENDLIKNLDSDTDETSEKTGNRNIICEINIVQDEDQNNQNLESLSDTGSENCKKHETKENQNGDNVTENVIKNFGSDTCRTSEILGSSDILFKCKNRAQLEKNNHILEILSNDVSDYCTINETEKKVIEHVTKNTNSDASNILSSNNIVCELENAAQEHLCNPYNKNLSNSVSDNITSHQIEINQSEECLIENVCKDHEDDACETLCNSNIVCKTDNIVQEDEHNPNLEILSSKIFDGGTKSQTSKNQSGESLIQNLDSNLGETSSNIQGSNIHKKHKNMVQEDFNKSCFKRSYNTFPDSCTTHQARKIQSGESTVETSQTMDSSNIVSEFKDIDHDKVNNHNLETLSSNYSESCKGFQTDKIPNTNSLVVNLITNLDINTVEEPKILDSKNVREFDNISQEKNTNPKLETLPKDDSDNVEHQNKSNQDDDNIDRHIHSSTNMSSNLSNTSKIIKELDCQEIEINPSLENASNYVSDKWNQHKQEENKSLNKTNIIVDDNDEKAISCNSNLDVTCYEVVQNDQVQLQNNTSTSNDLEITIQDSPVKRRLSLKRSLSDSALNSYKSRDAADRQVIENPPLVWPSKRQRMFQIENSEQHIIDENLCSFIQNTRRNSVSSFYNEEHVSFCILIDDNCIITEENEGDKICFAEISEDCITEINTTNDEDNVDEIICCSQEDQLDLSESVILDYENEKTIQEAWLDDVACVETVVSDDIVEDVVINANDSQRNVEILEYDESGYFNCDMSGHADEVTFINEQTMSDNVSQIIETYRSPHTDNKEMTYDKESQGTELCNDFYEKNTLEKVLSESNSRECSPSPISDFSESILITDDTKNSALPEDKENMENVTLQSYEEYSVHNDLDTRNSDHFFSEDINQSGTSCSMHDDAAVVYESILDSVLSHKEGAKDVKCITSSSSEVSSTTTEEKSSSILLKITNYNGSRVSEINEVNLNRPRCKFTEENEYSNSHGSFPKRPLMTKGAQKYIPPIKESIRDLKVKLSLPQQRLIKLKQLKLNRNESKVNKQNNTLLTIPKKPKLNFEDVLKNIDEVQIKMHKEKSKKTKNIIPKVVIKKNMNGSHYTSSTNKDTFNPDLTGRKWQPWVFLEKNNFIDKMASRNKTKAIFSHRLNTYVLAEKFRKYKSVSNCSAKFVISKSQDGDSSKGQLKCTIRLKHTY